MAFVRRKGNKFYLVHNVRRGEKVKQIHLARLGERAQITERVVREVSKKHPFVELNWQALREQLNGRQVDLADSDSPVVQKLVGELLLQLRLLQSTLQVKLSQFDHGRGRFASSHSRGARRRP